MTNEEDCPICGILENPCGCGDSDDEGGDDDGDELKNFKE